jgi:hypothetical protein
VVIAGANVLLAGSVDDATVTPSLFFSVQVNTHGAASVQAVAVVDNEQAAFAVPHPVFTSCVGFGTLKTSLASANCA